MRDFTEIFENAKKASRNVAKLSTEEKNVILLKLSEKLQNNVDLILEENKKDILNFEKNNTENLDMIDRLLLTEERILAILGPNDFFGEAFLSANAYYRVDAIALTESVTCPVSRKQFTQMAVEAPSFVLTMAEILAQHMFDCRDQLSTSYAPVKARVAKVLCDLAERFGEKRSDEWVKLSTELKHEELASMITATRVSVSMAIAELRNDGFIEGTRGEYLLNVEALAQDFEGA